MVVPSMDLQEWLRKQLEETDPDLLREIVQMMAAALMSADADAACNATYGERTDERTNRRNGYRSRRWDTRVGTIDLAIPKLRSGTYFPDWLLEPRRRAEKAFIAVVADCYLAGVSTRRVDKLAKTLGIDSISSQQVSELAKELDAIVEAFRNRPLDGAPYTYVWFDAHTEKVREPRSVSVSVVKAIGVNKDGYREVLGLDIITAEDGAGWLAFLRSLKARGLSGVELAISDDHPGLVEAIASVFSCSWQRCRTHFARNVLTKVPKSAQGMVAALVRSIFAQGSSDEVWAQHARVVEQLRDRFPRQRICWKRRAKTCLRSPPSPKRTGARSGPTTRSRDATRRSAAAPTSSASSPTAPRSSASPKPCSPSNTTNGWWRVRYMSVESLGKARVSVIEGTAVGDREEVRNELEAAS